jgi:hypothetical protein
LPHAVVPPLQRTSVTFRVRKTLESLGGPGAPTCTSNLMNPTEFAAAPFASGVPTVKKLEGETGGLQEGNASGGPWVRFGAVHWLYAGTSGIRIGVAPFGRGCVAPATWAANMESSTAIARAAGKVNLALTVVLLSL